MNINKSALLSAAILSLIAVGQTATADERAPRDEYSIGVVWDVAPENVATSRVNFEMQNKVDTFSYYGENAPRDEYSIGVVWDVASDNAATSRVNFEMQNKVDTFSYYGENTPRDEYSIGVVWESDAFER
jgi:predicted RecA/RadA family phage recombinase